MWQSIINYLKYSGLSFTISVNPYHWSWMPVMRSETDDAWNAETQRFTFLFLTIRLWIDDGSW